MKANKQHMDNGVAERGGILEPTKNLTCNIVMAPVEIILGTTETGLFFCRDLMGTCGQAGFDIFSNMVDTFTGLTEPKYGTKRKTMVATKHEESFVRKQERENVGSVAIPVAAE